MRFRDGVLLLRNEILRLIPTGTQVLPLRIHGCDQLVLPFLSPSLHLSFLLQRRRVVIHLLEPNGPDSFVYWGFFNSIFEQKEYGENYILEKLAIKLLAEDPKLQEEFDRRLLDPAFARSPRARLEFFYQHSPYYLNQKVGIYPVGRVIRKQ